MSDAGTELLVEIQCEELPARFLQPAMDALGAGVVGLLQGIGHGPARVYGTPRRIAVIVDDVALERPKVERWITGPPADRAFDASGAPTPAAVGFAKGKGVDPSQIRVVDGPKGQVIAIPVSEGGQRTLDRLSEGLAGVLLGIAFPKSMEWAKGGTRWGRPFHRVVALLHGDVIPGEVAGIPFGRETVGHRLAADTAFAVRHASDWLSGLRARSVEPDPAVREAQIRALLASAAARFGADTDLDEALLAEVVHLVEAPTLVIGEFDPALLELPPRLLVQSMKTHQRYFPIRVDGQLTHRFAVISNNPWGDPTTVARGNARVLKARFDDARFFLQEDAHLPLAQHGASLARMRWIRGLGTMADKQARVAALGAALAPRFGADPAVCRRAGALAKCDLVSKMVGEFPELQGHMGRIYAAKQGEPAEVAVAIEEHYLPRGSGDEVAASPAGRALAVADRLDTLVGCFGIGLIPTSGGDPQGLRRAVAGVSATLVAQRSRGDLTALLEAAVDAFHAAAAGQSGFEAWTERRGAAAEARDRAALVSELVAFAVTRLKAAAVAEGATADLVDAVVEVTPADPLLVAEKVAVLKGLAGHPDFGAVLQTFKRVLNIARGQTFPPPAASALHHPAERQLADALAVAEAASEAALARLDVAAVLEQALALRPPVAALFDAVMVDSPNPAEKAARIGLLLQVSRVFLKFADFSRISTR